MGAVLSTAVALAAVCAILMRLCALPAAKVCRPKRRVLIKLWEGFCSFLTKVHGTAREAYLVPLHVNEIVLAPAGEDCVELLPGGNPDSGRLPCSAA